VRFVLHRAVHVPILIDQELDSGLWAVQGGSGQFIGPLLRFSQALWVIEVSFCLWVACSCALCLPLLRTSCVHHLVAWAGSAHGMT
jgi:hypothetical protein